MSNRYILGNRAWLAAAAAATVAIAGCGGSKNDELPLFRAAISLKSVSMGGVCDVIPVRITPVELRGEANKYANNRTMVIEIDMAGPTDENGAPMCNGSGESLPMAPGDWEFSAPLASGPAKCVRDMQPAGDLNIIFIDGVEGCSGAPPAPAYEADYGTEGEAGEGEAGEGAAAADAGEPAAG